MNGDAGNGFRLALIGHEIICRGNFFEIQRQRGSGIHDAANAMRLGKANRVADSGEGDFKLQQNGVSLAEKWRGGIHILGREGFVRAFDNQDAVLPTGVDKDRRDAGGDSFRDPHVTGIDALGLEVLYGGRSKQIIADLGDHADGSATSACGHSLVGALSSKTQVEFLSENRFARPWKRVVEDRQVNIGASHHRNLLFHDLSPGTFCEGFGPRDSSRNR